MHMTGQFIMLEDCWKHWTYHQTVSLCSNSVSRDFWKIYDFLSYIWQCFGNTLQISIRVTVWSTFRRTKTVYVPVLTSKCK